MKIFHADHLPYWQSMVSMQNTSSHWSEAKLAALFYGKDVDHRDFITKGENKC